MSWFSRKQSSGPQGGPPSEPDQDLDDTAAAPDPASVAERSPEDAAVERRRRSQGPFDVGEVSDRRARVDLGALRVPAHQGMELRLEVQESATRVLSVTVALGPSAMQLQAFAAPRTEGLWASLVPEIAAEVARQGGSCEEAVGGFGRELLARVPVRTEDGRTGHAPRRFIGVDGPRWFLRAVLTGPAAADAAAAEPLEALLRGVVVVRGPEAMVPRDLLPLKLPAPGAAGPSSTDAAAASAPLVPFARGPEVTETR